MPKTRYFYDCEFHEDGKTVDLISIGIVSDDDREYYAVNQDADWERIGEHEWLTTNVVPHLPIFQDGLTPAMPDRSHPAVKPRRQIAAEVASFLTANSADRRENELWALYGAYDHVALCQLWGRMIDLPRGVPMYTNDLMQTARVFGVDVEEEVPQQGAAHDALADARWDRQAWLWLLQHAGGGRGLLPRP